MKDIAQGVKSTTEELQIKLIGATTVLIPSVARPMDVKAV